MTVLNFCLNTITKQVIISLCSYRCKNYTSLILCDFKISFLRDRWIEQFPCLSYFKMYLIEACIFSRFIGFRTVYSPKLISCDFFRWLVRDFKRVINQILEMFFPLLNSFFLTGRFHSFSQSCFLSIDFIAN